MSGTPLSKKPGLTSNGPRRWVEKTAHHRERTPVFTEAEERRLANVKWILKVVYGIEEPDE